MSPFARMGSLVEFDLALLDYSRKHGYAAIIPA
jgi:hypothetical protein